MSLVEKTSSALWNPQRRRFTGGLILIVTLAAFEAMGVGTALPTIVGELHGQRWYSWPFTVFMAASALATVLAGRVADRRGPALPLLVAMPTFAAGLVIAGSSTDMTTLLVARGLQGLGGGSEIVALYVMIARVYPEEHRPAVFGALSAAWVLPALVGPTIAGLLTEHLSWRWVFLGLAPLVCLGAALLVPTVRRLGKRPEDAVPGRRGVPFAAVGAAVGLIALEWAAQNPSLLSLFLGAAAVAVIAPALRTLLPTGTLHGRPGIPVMVLSRGLLAGVFFGAQAFVPLMLSVVHHFSPATAGIPLTIGSIGWATGSQWQSRQRRHRREILVATGLLLVATGVAGLTVVAPHWGLPWLVFVLWFVSGTGMGIGTASTAVSVMALSPATEQGFNSAALQIADMLGQATLVGLGGVVVSALASTDAPTWGVIVIDPLLACLAVFGAGLGYRRSRLNAPSHANPDSPL